MIDATPGHTASIISGLPLIRHFQSNTALAWIDKQPVSPALFLTLVKRLAVDLPEVSNIINLCEDRYHFLLAFAAALIAGKLTLTPASSAPEAIARIQRDFSNSHVVDDRMLAERLQWIFARTVHASEMDFSLPYIPAEQAAITLFTSGSSGQPTAHCKTWGMLVKGADQLQHVFHVQPGSCIIGTVPPQHMFGLESTIIFPLQWGCTIQRERPLLPADIEQAVVHAHGPVWLMTTPVHLRALVREAPILGPVSGVISATMPLDQTRAQAVEKTLCCPLHEIYGCTEAGITATRRPAVETVWHLCSDFSLRVENKQKDGQTESLTWLEGKRVTKPLALTDNIEIHAPGRFSLHGRSGDMIKIAGKRTTLAALNAELLSIAGVSDGCFYLPEPNAEGGTKTKKKNKQEENLPDEKRLIAFVVTSCLNSREIIAALRQRIDSVFIPRPLWIVTTLPRDSNGKISRMSLVELVKAQVSVDAVASIVAVNECSGIIASDHPALDGHFPENPIVPGVLLLNEVIQLALKTYCVTGIRQAKFHAVLKPGQPYSIKIVPAKADQTSGLVKFMIQHQYQQSPIASGLLQCEELHAGS